MNLEEHYTALYNNAKHKIVTNTNAIDVQIDNPIDTRKGITLLVRPNDAIKKEIANFLQKLSDIEPEQYAYPSTDIHCTVLSIISCVEDFNLGQIKTEEYIQLIESCLKKDSSFTIHFKGVTLSPSCVMLQGFLEDNSLNSLRDNLRASFKNSELQQSLDKRYTLQTAHSTIFRFKKELDDKGKMLAFIEKYREYDFGSCTFSTMELVYNGWYQKIANTKKLHVFKL